MKISLVIPTLYFEDKKEIFSNCISSMYGQFDELIVISENIDNLAKKINLGMSKATGDYIMVCNDDITLFKGTLNELCDPDRVTVPKVIGGIDKLFHGHFWCMSREVYKKVGPIYEGYDGFFYDDSDYHATMISMGIPVIKMEEVVILHPHPGTTLSQLHREGREGNNRNLFIQRWGKDMLRKVQA